MELPWSTVSGQQGPGTTKTLDTLLTVPAIKEAGHVGEQCLAHNIKADVLLLCPIQHMSTLMGNSTQPADCAVRKQDNETTAATSSPNTPCAGCSLNASSPYHTFAPIPQSQRCEAQHGETCNQRCEDKMTKRSRPILQVMQPMSNGLANIIGRRILIAEVGEMQVLRPQPVADMSLCVRFLAHADAVLKCPWTGAQRCWGVGLRQCCMGRSLCRRFLAHADAVLKSPWSSGAQELRRWWSRDEEMLNVEELTMGEQDCREDLVQKPMQCSEALGQELRDVGVG